MDERTMEIDAQINAYKQLLSQTDYQALKHADGVMSDEEYESACEARQFYRDEINRLENEKSEIEPDAPEGSE